MIPAPLVPPPAAPVAWRTRTGTFQVRSGWVLVVAGLLGLTLWYVALTPLSFARFAPTRMDTTIGATGGTRYVITAEGPGASTLERMPAVALTVRATGGRPVRVEVAAEVGEELDTPGYALLGNEGRVLATFRAPEDGNYNVTVTNLAGPGASAGASSPVPERYGVGPEAALTWWGAWWGALALGGMPVALGVALILTGRRVARSTDAPRGGPAADRR